MKNAPPPISKWHNYRIFGLFILALFTFRFGVIYTPLLTRTVRVPKALDLITAIIPSGGSFQPIWVLGFIWVLLGVFALAAMIWMRLHNAVFIATGAFSSYWTLAYFISPFTDEGGGSADVLAGVFLLVAALFVNIVGLLTRPAVRLDVPPVQDYPEFASEHIVIDPGDGDE